METDKVRHEPPPEPRPEGEYEDGEQVDGPRYVPTTPKAEQDDAED